MSLSSLRVCQVVGCINRDTGGPAITVPRLAASLAGAGVQSTLATLDYPWHGPQTPTENTRVVSLSAGASARRLRGWSPAFQAELVRLGTQTDVFHSHGLWMFPNLYARQAAVRAKCPLVISPRGMVEEWSLGRSRLKKFLAWHAFERDNLAAAALFHATSADEAASLRALGLRQPVAVIPNATDLPDPVTIPERKVLEARFPELAGQQWLLFLSRLHPKKGVAELLRAWRELAPRFPGWQLVLAGAAIDDYGEIARREAAALGLSARVTFTGVLGGAEKSCALGHAELFVLPTHSENFGIAIAEALAHGVPVLTTTGAPWSELTKHACGWRIELSHATLAAQLDSALRLPAPARREMGARGRALIQGKHSWAAAAGQMLAAYLWICGRGAQPDCIRTN